MIYKYLYYKSLANDGNNEERWQKKNTTTTSTIRSSTVLYDEKEKIHDSDRNIQNRRVTDVLAQSVVVTKQAQSMISYTDATEHEMAMWDDTLLVVTVNAISANVTTMIHCATRMYCHGECDGGTNVSCTIQTAFRFPK